MTDRINQVVMRNPDDKLEWFLTQKQITRVYNEIDRLDFWTDSILSDAHKHINPNIRIELLSNGRFDLMVRNNGKDLDTGYLNEKSLRVLLSKLDFAIEMVKLAKEKEVLNQ